jgi:transposase, IS30 family
VFAPLPAHMKRTLTWDQGEEMARHRELAAATGIAIYFAERSSLWQRGASENFNGLLRQYPPKGTDLFVHAASRVAAVMRELNNRPRKALDCDAPGRLVSGAKWATSRQPSRPQWMLVADLTSSRSPPLRQPEA